MSTAHSPLANLLAHKLRTQNIEAIRKQIQSHPPALPSASMYVYYCRTYEKAVNSGGERGRPSLCPSLSLRAAKEI